MRQAIARDVGLDDRAAFEALSNAATEDIKHVGLFREVRGRVNAALGFPLALLPEVGRVTSVVLRKHIGAVLLLTERAGLGPRGGPSGGTVTDPKRIDDQSVIGAAGDGARNGES